MTNTRRLFLVTAELAPNMPIDQVLEVPEDCWRMIATALGEYADSRSARVGKDPNVLGRAYALAVDVHDMGAYGYRIMSIRDL